MTKSKDLRDVVIAHYQNSKNAPEISTMLANKVHRVTVRRFYQSGSVNCTQIIRETTRWNN